jgi:hypothetical protein
MSLQFWLFYFVRELPNKIHKDDCSHQYILFN